MLSIGADNSQNITAPKFLTLMQAVADGWSQCQMKMRWHHLMFDEQNRKVIGKK
jgi:hypothetical protein